MTKTEKLKIGDKVKFKTSFVQKLVKLREDPEIRRWIMWYDFFPHPDDIYVIYYVADKKRVSVRLYGRLAGKATDLLAYNNSLEIVQ